MRMWFRVFIVSKSNRKWTGTNGKIKTLQALVIDQQHKQTSDIQIIKQHNISETISFSIGNGQNETV